MNNSSDFTRIPVILCIDVEPDEFFVDRNNPKPWSGFEFTNDYLKGFRSRFEEATGKSVHFNWSLRMDPQVATSYGSATYVADQYAALLEEYRSMGDDLGIHVHTYRWSDSQGGWLDDCGNPDWASECLQSSAESFKDAFRAPARTLRFGNFWLSTRAINEAESLGIEYDLTVEPGLKSVQSFGGKPPQSGPTPNFFRVPRLPYTPSKSEFRKSVIDGSGRSIVMIPLTSAYIRPGWGTWALKHRFARLVRNGFRGRLQSFPLSMWRQWNGNNTYTAMLDRAISVQKRPYLAFAVRSDINGKDFQAYDSSLKALLNHTARSRFVFCTPEEAMKHLSSVSDI